MDGRRETMAEVQPLPTLEEARLAVRFEGLIPKDLREGSLMVDMLLPLLRAYASGRLVEVGTQEDTDG